MKKNGVEVKADNLSDSGNYHIDRKSLDLLAEELDSEQLKSEFLLRKELIQVEKALAMNRLDKGRILKQYRRLYGQHRLWISFCSAIGINERTARRLIEGYDAASAVAEPVRNAAMKRGIDLAAKRNRGLAVELSTKADADALVSESDAIEILNQARQVIKSKRQPGSGSSQQRIDVACRRLRQVFDEVSPQERLEELAVVFQQIGAAYDMPATVAFEIGLPAQQPRAALPVM